MPFIGDLLVSLLHYHIARKPNRRKSTLNKTSVIARKRNALQIHPHCRHSRDHMHTYCRTVTGNGKEILKSFDARKTAIEATKITVDDVRSVNVGLEQICPGRKVEVSDRYQTGSEINEIS